MLGVTLSAAVWRDTSNGRDDVQTGDTTAPASTDTSPPTNPSDPTDASPANQAPATEAPGTAPSAGDPDPTTAEPGSDDVACVADDWGLRRRLAQLLMVGVDPSGTADARRSITDDEVGGIFIGDNPTELLTSGVLPTLTGPDGVAPFVAVDDEGGRVQRIDELAGDLPSARALAATETPAEVERLAAERGRRLAELGVTVDFAPVVDVSSQPDGAVIGDRSYNSDPAVVTEYAGAFAAGLAEADVLAVYKHFPGHGRAEGDSHLRTSTAPPYDELDVDLAPYRALLPRADRRAAAVMVGHLVVPGLTNDLPASVSPEAVDGLLRDELAFDGLVFSDDLGGMAAITDRFDPSEAVRLALVAGIDVPLISNPTDVGSIIDRLEADVADGSLPPATVDGALQRILRTKGHACG
ncbi:glycoside hydrolase family 3 N-terminal domain-containing protein [soil metagenome]